MKTKFFASLFVLLSVVGLAAQTPDVRTLLQQGQAAIVDVLKQLPVPSMSTTVTCANLQAAVDAAKPGAVLALPPGALCRGTLELRGTGPITITTDGWTVSSARVAPTDAGRMAALQANPDGTPALHSLVSAAHFVVRGIEIRANPCFCNDTVILEGDDVALDQVYLHGDPVGGSKRGVALSGSHQAVTNSYLSDFKLRGQDAQAIASWNGPGPFTIVNDYLAGAAENVIFGGSDPTTPGLVPADILIAGNTIVKPLAWKTEGWVVKNLLELKSARRVLIRDNVLEGSWRSGQEGYGLVLTVRNQDGTAPQSVIEDVVIQDNIFRHTGAGINILGADDTFPSGQMARVMIRRNQLLDVDPGVWGGSGRQIQIGNGPAQLAIVDNVFSGKNANSAMTFSNTTPKNPLLRNLCVDLVITGNTFDEGDYGVIGDGAPALGAAVLELYAPGYVWDKNTIRKGASGRVINYPAGTTLV